MAKLGWRRLPACAAAVGVVLAAGVALAGSAWFSLDREKIVCDVLGTGTCTVELAWTVSKEDKFDKWKICWKEREASSWLDDHCDYHSKVRTIGNNFYAIPDLDMDREYRVKLEARRERNENWTCVLKTMIRNVGHTAWLGDGGICVDF